MRRERGRKGEAMGKAKSTTRMTAAPSASIAAIEAELRRWGAALDNVLAAGLLAKAAATIGGPRAATHGDFRATHTMTAKLWSASLGIEIRPHQVPLLLAQAKHARALCGDPGHEDHYLDPAGYEAQAFALALSADPPPASRPPTLACGVKVKAKW